jgi:hypothetical protein
VAALNWNGNGTYSPAENELTYPIAQIKAEMEGLPENIGRIKFRLEHFFFGVTLKNGSEDQQKLTVEQLVTNMLSVDLNLLIFRAERPTRMQQKLLSAWEVGFLGDDSNNF